MPRAVKLAMLLSVALLGLTGCMGDDTGASETQGQISRPADVGLPLDNPSSVAAFDVADDFLLSWFFRDDNDRALLEMRPDLRESWRSLLEETDIDRDCSLLQVEGSVPDASGAVTARYAIGGCRVVPPGGKTAVFIQLTMTNVENRYWVNQIEFLR